MGLAVSKLSRLSSTIAVEPVKRLVIGSREAVNAIVHSLHQHRFAEVFEWTDFLTAPSETNPLQTRLGGVMKALVKYLPRDFRESWELSCICSKVYKGF